MPMSFEPKYYMCQQDGCAKKGEPVEVEDATEAYRCPEGASHDVEELDAETYELIRAGRLKAKSKKKVKIVVASASAAMIAGLLLLLLQDKPNNGGGGGNRTTTEALLKEVWPWLN